MSLIFQVEKQFSIDAANQILADSIVSMVQYNILTTLLFFLFQTRVESSSMWLLKLALPFSAALKSKVAVGIWVGDIILPLVASGCFSIPDRSGNIVDEPLYYNRESITITIITTVSNLKQDLPLTLCQTTMLWSMAQPQSTIPTLITILVVMAGVEGNWMIVYKTISVAREKETAY